MRLAAAETPVLIVPSALVPQEDNVLVNPGHEGAVGRVIGVEAFTFDPRLASGGR